MSSETMLMLVNTAVTVGLTLRCWRLERALTGERCRPADVMCVGGAACAPEEEFPLRRGRVPFQSYGVDISVAPTIPVGDA